MRRALELVLVSITACDAFPVGVSSARLAIGRAACPLVGHPKAAPQHGASNSYSAARSLQSRPLGLPTPNGAAPPARFRAAVQLSASRTGRCNFHSGDRTEYDSGDRASPAACHGFREVAKSGAQPEQCSRLSNARASREFAMGSAEFGCSCLSSTLRRKAGLALDDPHL